jgi:hypothetical protein
MQYIYPLHFASSPTRFGWSIDNVWKINLVHAKLVLHTIYNMMRSTHNIKITQKYLHGNIFREPTARTNKTRNFGGDVRLKAIKQGTNLLCKRYSRLRQIRKLIRK